MRRPSRCLMRSERHFWLENRFVQIDVEWQVKHYTLIFTLQVPLTLTSKAFNAAWNVQPENPNYNAHGCCVNHW